MKYSVLLMVVLVLLCGIQPVSLAGRPAAEAGAAGHGPRAALQGPAEDGQLSISLQDRCPVCGMFPAKRPETAAAMQLRDGRAFYFCGNGCLLRTLRDSRTHLGVAEAEIDRMIVRDYFTGKGIDARGAWWVAGSDVIGPMGPALVALQNEADVQTFKKRHGGKHVFTLGQLDDAMWQKLFPARHK